MKIIKPGCKNNEQPILRFECFECGCIFDAKDGEYENKYFGNKIHVFCFCPNCNTHIWKY